MVSISLILTDVEDYSYVYWSLLCLLWKNIYWSLYTFLKVSYLPFVVLKLSCSSCYIFWILAPYSDARFADTSSYSISSLSVDVEETIFSWCGQFRTLAKIIWPHMCEFIQDSLLMIHWCLCLFCCRWNTVLTTVAFLPVLNSGSLKTPLSFFALKISFVLWVSLRLHKFQYLGIFFFPFLWKWHETLWVVSIYMYITFRSIGRSTTLNVPVNEYSMVFWLLVSSFFQKHSMVFSAQIFHFLRGLLCCLAWDL